MRRRRLLVVTVVVTAAACGGGGGGGATGGGDTTSSSSAASAGATTSTSAVDGAGSTAPGGGTANPGQTDPGSVDPPDPPDIDPASLPFPPPDAGSYVFHTTGTAQAPGQVTPQAVDRESTRTIERLNDTDIRQSETEGQTSVLRYLPDQVQLLRLDFVVPPFIEYHFVPDPPALFARVPPVPGDAWEWQVTESQGRTTVHQRTTVVQPETIEVAGGTVDASVLSTRVTFTGEFEGTIDLTSWVDPARRTTVRIHQVSDITYNGFRGTSDTTSELVSFTAG